MSDPGNYRTRAEIEKYQERDPLKVFAATLRDENILSDKDYEAMEKQVQADVEHALRFADESPLPEPEKLYTDVYANPIEPAGLNRS
jgi:pyruvate dehydrogenase E1 component alpha subunit